ncbi:MAG: WD40 repeat domain-containing protein, partial [Gemmataceae bacterium]|nr:WD40 repeat domain-containing protein [Gemmataceae bacterium]
ANSNPRRSEPPVRVLSDHTRPVDGVAFSPDGTRLAEVARGGDRTIDVRVWSVATGEVVDHLSATCNRWRSLAARIAFGPDGKALAVACGDVIVFPLDGGNRQRFSAGGFYAGDGYSSVAFDPNGGSLLSAGYRLNRWSLASGKALPKLKFPAPKRWNDVGASACAFARDGARFAFARRVTATFGTDESNREQLFVCGSEGVPVDEPLEWVGFRASQLRFSPDGTLVAACAGPVVRVWNLASRELVAELEANKKYVTGLAFAADGRHLATVSRDTAMRLWDVGSWGASQVFEWQVGALHDVAFAPDGMTGAVAGDKGRVVVFDVD